MQIVENIHGLKIRFPSTAGAGQAVERFVYLYFICDAKVCVVDGGVAAAFPDIVAYLEQIGRKPADIDLLVHTHSHPDHIGGSFAIREASGCRVAAYVAAKPWIEDIDLQYRLRPTGTFYQLVSKPVPVDQVLNDGDAIHLAGGRRLRVVHTPGHSVDSMSLLDEQDGVLFTGDAIPLAGDRPLYDDVPAQVASLRKLKALGGVKVLCSSWHEPLYGSAIPAAMDAGLAYIQQVHAAVLKTRSQHPSADPGDLVRRILADLSLPGIPNVVKSIEAHLAIADRPDVLTP